MLGVIAFVFFVSASYATPTRSSILPVSSPAYYPEFPFFGTDAIEPVPTGPLYREALDLSNYPSLWSVPDTNHPEVQEAIASIDWNYVPSFMPRPTEWDNNYDNEQDEACWWSHTECIKSKLSYLPADIAYCNNRHDFGLTYDDGPLNPVDEDDIWAEPRLYDFLANLDQEATMFYVGSNVVTFPQAAKRALESGHTLCAHTWSHPQMTSISNEQIVAELYWNVRAIKESTGVTTRCWRPPFGDVDDRVRAIAHQMGLATILWNSDSFDWKLPSIANDYAGTFNQSDVDGFFRGWIKSKIRHGRIVLEHETSDMTIKTTERWLPRLKKHFSVKKVHDCVPHLSNPYWES